ncbi:MFS general substrate transporter, partial [Aureobasidium melanogenum]
MAAPNQTFAMDGLEGLEKKNLSAQHLEIVATQSEHNIEWLAQFPLIADKSPEELRKIEKGLLRKLDWIFLPVVTLMLLMGYLDRINVGNARLAGMQKDLGMDDTTYSLGISAFYIGYIISQLPATIYLARGRPQIQMPVHVVIWSVITACMALMSSGWSFVLCRFLVGVAEGPFLPMVSLMSSSWYTKEEAPLRMAIWHAGNIASNIFSGLLAAAILATMEGINGIAAWSWFFIIEGSVGVFVGLAGFYCIPNFPHNHNTKWLTDEQAQMAQYRMLVSSGGVSEDDDTSAWKGVWLACKDPFTWIYTVLHFGLIVSLSEKDFFPSIVKTLGYSKLMTYLIQAPPYVFAYIATLVISWSAGRYKEHCWHIVGSSMLTIIGTACVIGTYNPGVRYFGMFFMCAGPFVGLNIHVPWETTNVFTPRSKRAAVVSITNSIASVSHWFTPYLFLTKQAPLYQEGGAMILSGAVLGILGCLVCKWPRVRKKRKTASTRPESVSGAGDSMRLDNWNAHQASFAGTVQLTASDTHVTDTSPVVTQPVLPEDPGTGGSSTYIGRHHFGDTAIDETSARDYGQSRQQGLSDLEQKTLELWDVFALPPRPLHESLLESFMQYCFPWMPLLEPSEAHVRDNQQSSLLLSQAIFLAASRVNPSPPVCEYASSAEFYQRAKALFWIGHEKNELTVIKATTMLHWYTPDGPAFVSHDTSEYWLKIGVGLAYQIGLHKEPPPGPQRAIRRRMWWSLVVRDSLISVSRGRPRAVNLEDSDVSMPTLDDFADAPQTGELFIAYVEVCCILGDLVQTCARRRMTTSKRTEVLNALFKWTRMLPARLMLAQYSVDTRSYEARPHDFLARQLHVPYFTSIIILARSGATGENISPAAVMAASFVAGIYEDFLARNLVGLLSPTFTTFAFISGLVLRSLRSYPGLWPAARKDLETILASLQQLSNRWRSAIGAYKVIQRALDHPVPTGTSPKRSLLSLSREEAPLFEGFPLHICRMWHASEAERAAQNVDFNLSDILPPQMDLAAERGSNSQAVIMNLNLLPDDSLFDVPFDDVPYFWGDWGVNG